MRREGSSVSRSLIRMEICTSFNVVDASFSFRRRFCARTAALLLDDRRRFRSCRSSCSGLLIDPWEWWWLLVVVAEVA